MQNKIIIYEAVEDDDSFEDSELYQTVKNIKNVEVCVNFYE